MILADSTAVTERRRTPRARERREPRPREDWVSNKGSPQSGGESWSIHGSTFGRFKTDEETCINML